MVSIAAKHREAVLAQQAKEAAKAAPARASATEPAPAPPLAVALVGAEDDGPRTSHAATYRREILARQAADAAPMGIAAARPETGVEATEYELLLAELGADMVRLRDIQSVEAKIALKRELVDAYDTHVDATIAAAQETGKALQDEVVTRMMLWRIDISDFGRALDIGEHVLTFGLAMPTNIVRQPAVLIAEEIAEAALKQDTAGYEFPLDLLDRTMTLTEAHDMPDQVRAKLYKARGRSCLRAATRMEANPENAAAGGPRAGRMAALAAFRRALELDKHAGVKKDIGRLASLERDAAPETN